MLLQPDLWLIKANEGQIAQIFLNLVLNARDAMPRGGKITIETANVHLDEHYAKQHVDVIPGSYVRLSVIDTGCGMDKETLSHIFEPFFTTKDVGKGTGLGLFTLYGIVKQSNGHLWVESEPEKGTTFKVFLPRMKETLPTGEITSKTIQPLQNRATILVVEDEKIVRDLACEILKIHGYNVLEAANGDQAIKFCQSHTQPIDLVISDVVMPQMSGPEFFQRISSIYPTIKVLFMSGYTGNTILHHGIEDSDIAFLEKPFTSTSLITKVQEILD